MHWVDPRPTATKPGAQSVHTVTVDAEYLPVAQLRHGPPLAPAEPALHSHSLGSVLPSAESLLAPHGLHGALPGALLNLPAAHGAHTAPSCPVYPALHWHTPSAALLLSERLCKGPQPVVESGVHASVPADGL